MPRTGPSSGRARGPEIGSEASGDHTMGCARSQTRFGSARSSDPRAAVPLSVRGGRRTVGAFEALLEVSVGGEARVHRDGFHQIIAAPEQIGGATQALSRKIALGRNAER